SASTNILRHIFPKDNVHQDRMKQAQDVLEGFKKRDGEPEALENEVSVVPNTEEDFGTSRRDVKARSYY
ncbi:hypothetical protein LTR39_004228, partial [Cryomyces antarcticus]